MKITTHREEDFHAYSYFHTNESEISEQALMLHVNFPKGDINPPLSYQGLAWDYENRLETQDMKSSLIGRHILSKWQKKHNGILTTQSIGQ